MQFCTITLKYLVDEATNTQPKVDVGVTCFARTFRF